MTIRPGSDALDKLLARIAALGAKTIENGCTEGEALAAAAKVAELLDRYDLTLDEVAVRASPCVEAVYAPTRKKRIPLDECVGAVADFFDCRVWRERRGDGPAYVFFGIAQEAEAARSLLQVIDAAVRDELGAYKTSRAYQLFRHQDRHLANASFALGMIASIADKLMEMKAGRDRARAAGGRDLVPVKTSVVDAELKKLGVVFRESEGFVPGRFIAPEAYDAGVEVGSGFSLPGGVAKTPARRA